MEIARGMKREDVVQLVETYKRRTTLASPLCLNTCFPFTEKVRQNLHSRNTG